MSDFTSVFSQERDHWRSRAEAAEAELERERARAREHLDARCRAEGRSEAWQMNADGWKQRATRAEAEVERLRSALDSVGRLTDTWIESVTIGDDTANDILNALFARAIRDVLRGDQ